MRNRLIFAMVGVVALILIVQDVPLARHLRRVEHDRLVTQYERDAFIIGGLSEEELDDGTAAESEGLRHAVEEYASSRGVEVVIANATGLAVVVADHDGEVVPGLNNHKVGDSMTNRSEFADVLETGEPIVGSRYSQSLRTELSFVSIPVVSGTNIVGVVRVSAPTHTVDQRVNDQIRGILVVASISLLIAIFVAWLLANGVTKPLALLRTATERFAAGDLSVRAPNDEGPREVNSLARSFNKMASQIETLVERQQRFASDASHQLRTPLTALRLQLEQLQTSVAQDPVDDKDLAQTVDSAVAETDRLRRIIEGLLALSRAEDATISSARVDLAAVARERAQHWEPLAAEHGVQIIVDAPGRHEVVAIPDAATQVADNLIDNALEVAPPDSTITIAVTTAPDGVTLSVADEGPGLQPEERERAFERFWRSPTAAPGGSGLGLSIVHQLVTASGGQCALYESSSGGIDARVTFERPD